MEKKKLFSEKLEAFFAGKGFYIVLFLCVAVIGVSAWSMLAGTGTDVDINTGDIGAALEQQDGDASVSTGLTEYPVIKDASASDPVDMELTAPPASQPPAQEPPAGKPEAPASSQAGEESASASPDYFIWPVNGDVENEYSMSALTYNVTMRDWRTHDGVDIAAELGAQVKSTANGVVAEVFEDDMLGTTVIISHRDGLTSSYSNLAATPTVSVGQQVSVGQVIGAVGNTALSESGEVTHLHFAMAVDGMSVDPGDYMP